MGDFLLDLRAPAARRAAAAADALRFTSRTVSRSFEEPAFGLALTYQGNADLWAPYTASDGSLVAVAGRVALDEALWTMGERMQGS
jgi:hypothetical protein